METGTSSGNGDRRERSKRRKTVSGAYPQLEDERESLPHQSGDMRFPWSSPSAPTSPVAPNTPKSETAPKSATHRRTFSGGSSIFAKLGFLRGAGGDDSRPASRDKSTPTSPTKSLFSRKSAEDDSRPSTPTSPNATEKESVLGSAMKQSKARNRKGSLRKTALLGGRIMSEGRGRKGSLSLLQRSTSAKQVQQTATLEQDESAVLVSPVSTEEEREGDRLAVPKTNRPRSLHRQFSYESTPAIPDSGMNTSEPAAVSAARLQLLTSHHRQSTTSTDLDNSPVDVKSPTSQTSNTSTTSDDDVLTFSRPLKPVSLTSEPTLSTAASSYFPPLSNTSSTSLRSRRHPKSKTRSPLSRTITSNLPTEPSEPHSYTETESWGWIILVLTWLTFTIGMGSTLEIWSWAWDVGETPYAPPDLQDDPTLPIVGYYPALIVLTGVVAWVWITVAWVGMKYFRHAKIEV